MGIEYANFFHSEALLKFTQIWNFVLKTRRLATLRQRGKKLTEQGIFELIVYMGVYAQLFAEFRPKKVKKINRGRRKNF
jgi:hypothetical protein